MAQYLISVYDHPGSGTLDPAVMSDRWKAIGVVNERMQEEGIFVFAGGLGPTDGARVFDGTGAAPVASDGPYLETKEYVGGLWIIDAPDAAVAADWCAQASAACEQVLELRAFLPGPGD